MLHYPPTITKVCKRRKVNMTIVWQGSGRPAVMEETGFPIPCPRDRCFLSVLTKRH